MDILFFGKYFLCFVMFDPLEQFDIILFIDSFTLTNLWLFLFFNLGLIVLINKTQHLSFKNRFNLFFLVQKHIEQFLDNILVANTPLAKQFIFAIYLCIFLLLLVSNVLGLVPFGYTITSSFIVTISLSFLIFFLINIVAMYNSSFFQNLNLFLPTGTPALIIVLIVVIELISYLARLFSLAIRLFANMMAGHTLLKILIGFSFTMLLSTCLNTPFAFVPWLLVTVIYILEILIALLQSYVFLILLSIYFNDVISSH